MLGLRTFPGAEEYEEDYADDDHGGHVGGGSGSSVEAGGEKWKRMRTRPSLTRIMPTAGTVLVGEESGRGGLKYYQIRR